MEPALSPKDLVRKQGLSWAGGSSRWRVSAAGLVGACQAVAVSSSPVSGLMVWMVTW